MRGSGRSGRSAPLCQLHQRMPTAAHKTLQGDAAVAVGTSSQGANAAAAASSKRKNRRRKQERNRTETAKETDAHLGREDAHALHLVEDGVVGGVNGVAAVHVTGDQERALPTPQHFTLLHSTKV